MAAPTDAERVRMCLSEAGYPNVYVGDDNDGDGPWMSSGCTAPTAVRWRAFALAVTGVPCLACWESNNSGGPVADCAAVDRMSLDCGVER